MLDFLRQLRDTYGHKPVAVLGALGFAAGLPFLLVFSTLTAWLTEAGIERSTIGFFAWVGMTYSVKVFWAPAIDRLRLPGLTRWLGKRRSWILVGQAGVVTGLACMSQLDPAASIAAVAVLSVLVAFSSATQDIAIDAYRIEIADERWQGALSAAYYFGYRLALLLSGAGALYLAEWGSWSSAYVLMALLAAAMMLVTLWADASQEDDIQERQSQEYQLVNDVFGRDMQLAQRPAWQRWWIGAVACPFLEFFRRNGWLALIILTFIGVFRLSDLAMGAMANPFYLDLGYSKSDIASVAKLFGFFMTIAGSALCGLLVMRLGIYRPLLLGAVLVASTNLLFAWLAWLGLNETPSLMWLAVVISADNLSGGIAGTAFIAYLSSLTNRHYTATQYALFSSLMTLPGKFISGFSGVVVDHYGYIEFFVIAAALGIPAIALVLYLSRCVMAPSSSHKQVV